MAAEHVFITGVSSGIGKALTEKYLQMGWNVSGVSRRACSIQHPAFRHFLCDVSKKNELKTAIEQAILSFGHPSVLINNAGLGYFGFLEDLPDHQWNEMFKVNVDAIFYTCQMILPEMKLRGRGHVVNIASTAALEGMAQVSGYSATKWAVRGLSESLWRECRDWGVKVTCVYPGAVETEFFKNSPGIKAHSYMLQAAEVAEAIFNVTIQSSNYHTVNLEIRPLQPKGPKK